MLLLLLLPLLLSAYFGLLLKGAAVKEDQACGAEVDEGRGRAVKAEGKGAHSLAAQGARRG